MTRDVLDKVGTLLVGEDASVEIPRLFEIELGNFGKVENGTSDELLVSRNIIRFLLVVESLDRRDVVGSRTLVVTESHQTISLEVGDRVDGSVDGELSVVGTETVSVSVGVREETGLENGIGGRLDTLDEVRRREGNLLNLGANERRRQSSVR
jgi:hypothetical protein